MFQHVFERALSFSILAATCAIAAEESKPDPARLAMERSETVEAYDRVGEKDPKWDAAATAFLEQVAIRLASSDDPLAKATGPQMSEYELTVLSDKAITLGCTDPLVLTHRARLMFVAGDEAGAVKRSNDAIPRLIQSKYSIYQKALACGVHVSMRDAVKWRPTSTQPTASGVFAKGVGDMLRAKGKPLAERRVRLARAVALVNATRDINAFNQLQGTVAELENDPWMAAMMRTELAIQGTYSHRGRQSLSGSLKNARTTLDEAAKLEPEAPETKTYLARMEALEKSPPPPTRRNDRPAETVEALLASNPKDMKGWEYLIAMSRYPHPSADKMLAIITAAADTKLYDTPVPMQFVQIISELGVTNPSLYTKPELTDRIEAVLNGYEALASTDAERTRLKTLRYIFAWRERRWADAAKMRAELGEKIDRAAIDEYGFDLGDADMRETLARHPEAAQIRSAFDLEAEGKFDQARAIWSSLSTKVNTPPASEYIRCRLQMAMFRSTIASKRTATLNVGGPQALVGWGGTRHAWSAAGGTFVCKSDKEGFYSLVHPMPVPTDRMVSLEFQLIPDREGNLPAAGVVNQINVRGKPVLSLYGGSKRLPYWRSVSVGGVITPEFPLRQDTVIQPNTWYRMTSIQQGTYYLAALGPREGIHFDDSLNQFGICLGTPAFGFGAALSGKGDEVRIRNVSVTTQFQGIRREDTPDHEHWKTDDLIKQKRDAARR